MPYVLPTEVFLDDLLQSSQHFSKFQCIRLKKDSEISGEADVNDGSSELSEMPNENLLKRILKLYERTGNKPSSLTMQSLQKAWSSGI